MILVFRFLCDHLEDSTLAFKRLLEIAMLKHEQQRQIKENINILKSKNNQEDGGTGAGYRGLIKVRNSTTAVFQQSLPISNFAYSC